MASGQPVLDATTKGGWFQAADNLRQSLIALGLPSREPLTTPAPATPAPPKAVSVPAAPDPAPALWPRVAVGLALLLAVAGGGALYLRRRSSPGAATTP
jgi:hypothetical protein